MTPFFPWSRVVFGGPETLPAVKGNTLKSALFGENLEVPGTRFRGVGGFLRFVASRDSTGWAGGWASIMPERHNCPRTPRISP